MNGRQTFRIHGATVHEYCLKTFATLAVFAASAAYAQDPAHATEVRMQHPGPGPDGKPRIAFLVHRLGTTTPRASPSST
jgi:hypothetical protein